MTNFVPSKESLRYGALLLSDEEDPIKAIEGQKILDAIESVETEAERLKIHRRIEDVNQWL